MKIPTTLKHKPVIVVRDYDRIDGRFQQSDAKGLSLGLAQWNDRGKVDISAKVWRYTGEKWSRQSEEMPLHRVIDLAILICRSKMYFQESYRITDAPENDSPVIERIPIQGDALDIALCVDNPLLAEDAGLFRDVLAKDDEMLSERLHRLAAILKEMGY